MKITPKNKQDKSEAKKAKEKLYGNNINMFLSQKGMSLQELADITDKCISHLSRIASGKRRCISLPIAFIISNALGEPVEKVFILNKPEGEKE